MGQGDKTEARSVSGAAYQLAGFDYPGVRYACTVIVRLCGRKSTIIFGHLDFTTECVQDTELRKDDGRDLVRDGIG